MKTYTTKNTLETVSSLLVQFPEYIPTYNDLSAQVEDGLHNIIDSFIETGQIVVVDGHLLRIDVLPDSDVVIRYLKETADLILEASERLVDYIGNRVSTDFESRRFIINEKLRLQAYDKIYFIDNLPGFAVSFTKNIIREYGLTSNVDELPDEDIVQFATEQYKRRMLKSFSATPNDKITFIGNVIRDWLFDNIDKTCCVRKDDKLILNLDKFEIPALTTWDMQSVNVCSIEFSNSTFVVCVISDHGKRYRLDEFMDSDVKMLIRLLIRIDADVNEI